MPAARPSGAVDELVDDDREDGGCRNRENRADEPPQRPADEQRDDDGDRAHADALLHDLRHQHVRLELVQHEKVDADADGELRRRRDRDADRGDAADDRSKNGNRLADRRDQRDDVEKRLAHQAEADSGERPHDAREHQLRPEPGADLFDRRALRPSRRQSRRGVDGTNRIARS